MESFENNRLPQEPDYIPREPEAPEVPEQTQQPQAQQMPEQPRNADLGNAPRKESPFADSPYVTNYQPGYTFTPPKKPKAKKERKGGFRKVAAALLTVALVAGSCAFTAAQVNERWEDRTRQMQDEFNARLEEMQTQIDAAAKNNQRPVTGMTPTMMFDMTPGQVYAENVHSVVLISCEVTTSMYGQTATGTSTGSGFILTENGYVVTNHHVVDGANRIFVSTHDGTEYGAVLIGSDATNDVAVLKVEAEGLNAVTVGSSAQLAVGDQVVAIGNPLGELTSTMTAGYVSAKNRDVTTDGRTINMIQTDAAINSGNSGGPLFNMKGEVVGITTAKYSGSSASGATIEGIGFAIPMDDVIGMVDDLVNYGYVTGAYLGVMVSDMDAEAAAYYGMPVGAYVQEVTVGGCAQKAGLKAKDIIVALGEYEVRNVSSLTRALRNFKAGDTTTLTVYRGGERLELTITLDAKPQATPSTDMPSQMPDPSGMPQDGSYEEWYNYFAPFFGFGNGGQNQD